MSYENMFGEDSLSIEKNHILGLLEREGLSLEVKIKVLEWTEKMEIRSIISSKEMIRFNVDRAELYEALGNIDEMFECLDGALYQITQEKNVGNESGNWEELENKIKKTISEMEEKYPA